MDKKLEHFLQKAEGLFDKIEQFLPMFEHLIPRIDLLLNKTHQLVPEETKLDWQAIAYRWRHNHFHQGYLQVIPYISALALEDLLCIDRQKNLFINNIEQFIYDAPFNHTLLSGARGTGKSSLVKAVLQHYHSQGLRVIEVDKQELINILDIIEYLYQRPEKFIIFSDDISFNAEDNNYKALKAILDGSLSNLPENVLLCITSNRRHLMPEAKKDNQEVSYIDGEIHPNEAIEEKISLSERFGLWLHFYPFKQEEYLTLVQYWLKKYNIMNSNEEIQQEALQYALQRGSRSGRIAIQFAKQYAGKIQLASIKSRPDSSTG